MVTTPNRAIVLSAGLGLRMRPITKTTPKPMIKVNKRPLLDHAIDRLEEADVETVVVNTHHLAETVQRHLAQRKSPKIIISHEEELLDTGGGIRKALPHLGAEPFFAVNADALWLNGPGSALERMKERWDDAEMDGLLLVHETTEAYGYTGVGDFEVDPWGKVAWRDERKVVPYVFTGVQIVHPRVFKGSPDGPFSMSRIFHKLIEAERLYAVAHDGEWFHIGTPNGLAQAEDYMRYRFPDNKKRP